MSFDDLIKKNVIIDKIAYYSLITEDKNITVDRLRITFGEKVGYGLVSATNEKFVSK